MQNPAGGVSVVLASRRETERLQAHDPGGVLGFNWGIDPASPEQVHEAQIGMEHRPARLDHDALADSIVESRTIYHFYPRAAWTAAGNAGLAGFQAHANLKEPFMPEAVIVSAVRTPVGRAPKGALSTTRPDDLAALAVGGALERVPGLSRAEVDDVILGCAQPEGEQGWDIARWAAAARRSAGRGSRRHRQPPLFLGP